MRTKYTYLRYHFIRVLHEDKCLLLEKIHDSKNQTDILTKVVTTEKLRLCMVSIVLRSQLNGDATHNTNLYFRNLFFLFRVDAYLDVLVYKWKSYWMVEPSPYIQLTRQIKTKRIQSRAKMEIQKAQEEIRPSSSGPSLAQAHARVRCTCSAAWTAFHLVHRGISCGLLREVCDPMAPTFPAMIGPLWDDANLE